jgi:hypothetical protein
MVPNPTQTVVITALRAFLINILPSSTDVFLAQINRVPEPAAQDFVMMTPIRRERIETNVDTYVDCVFTASISGVNMTVSAIKFGSITIGNFLFGTNVSAGTTIVSQTSGAPGGDGVYVVSATQTVSSEKMACGVQNLLQPTKFVVQLDVHGPNSADNAQTISTLMRDEYAYDAFKALNPNVSPFYADDPKQIPFLNDQSQIEWRWVLEATLQVNATVTVPQEFADVIEQTLIPADIIYPVQ